MRRPTAQGSPITVGTPKQIASTAPSDAPLEIPSVYGVARASRSSA